MKSGIVSAEKLFKSYGDQVAVDGLSFGINRGETFGLLGPNGAGKTTTISMLVGLLKPDSGEVTIRRDQNGNDVGSPLLPEFRRMVGIAPQQLSLYDDLTAKENLNFFGQLYGLSGQQLDKRVDWALEFAKLTDRKNDRVGTYSGGMKRRINIAVALVHEPEIILLDEPTVGVDPQSRNHIFDCIEQLQSKGITVLYTTHYMEEAQRLCDRVAIMDHGKLLALDTVMGLVEKHGGRSVVSGELGQRPEQISFPGSVDDDLKFRFESNTPLDEVASLSSQGVQFQTLSVTKPDLESVFLTLTGRSLRD
ncbi:MAG: ABC transporter ATP-binding protein [Planctomycetota bacterium]